MDYQELTVPLRDIMNYEAHSSNDSDTYQKLIFVQRQLNTSLRELGNIVSKFCMITTLQFQPNLMFLAKH